MKYSAVRLGLALMVLSIVGGVLFVFFFVYAGGLWEVGSSDVDSPSSGGVAGVLVVRPGGVLFRVGDQIDVEGVAEVVTPGGSIQLEVVDPGGDLWDSGEVEVRGESGRYLSFFVALRTVRDSDPSGVYLLRARYGGVQNTSSFLVSTSSGLTSEIRGLHLQSMEGDVVSQVRLGDTVMVAGSIVNHGGVPTEVSFTVEVRDENSNVAHSGYVGTTIPPGEGKTLTVGWPARVEGAFTVYAYVTEDSSRRIISNVGTLSFQVVP